MWWVCLTLARKKTSELIYVTHFIHLKCTVSSMHCFIRAMGILLIKLFINAKFKGLQGTSTDDWDDFEVLLGRRMQQLRARVGKDGVSEETHHVGLACELIEACLQQQPEDRCIPE